MELVRGSPSHDTPGLATQSRSEIRSRFEIAIVGVLENVMN